MIKKRGQLMALQTRNLLKILGISLSLVMSGAVHALRFEPSDQLSIDLDTTLAYGAMWRVQSQSKSITNPVIPLGDITLADKEYGMQVTRWNGDDGDRNFDKGDMVSNRFAITSDMDTKYEKYGVFLRAQVFYDSVYFGSTSWSPEGAQQWGYNVDPTFPPGTDCNSAVITGGRPAPGGPAGNPCGYVGPESINNAMASGYISDPSHFSRQVKDSQGYKARFLDAYVYGSFDLGGHTLDLRVGRQAISWGEALMLQGGIGSAQNRINAVAATSPGVELKEIFLPAGRVYGQIDLTSTLTMEAYWQYEWMKSELFADGSYFSTEDLTTGSNKLLVNTNWANCMYGSTEYFGGKACGSADGWTGTVGNSLATMNWLQTGLNYMQRADDVNPDAPADQYGLAFRKLLDGGSEVGVYFVQYHDTFPSVWAGNNGAKESVAPVLDPALNPSYSGPVVDNTNAQGFNGGYYTVQYAERLKMYGLSFNTVVDDIQLGFEVAYRPNQPVVTSCSQAQLDASTFDPTLAAIATTTPNAPNLAAAGASMKTDCKDDSLKYYAQTGGYHFDTTMPNGTGSWDSTTSSHLLAWPKQVEVFTYNMGATMVLPTTSFWDTAFFVGELGGFYVGSGMTNEDLKQSSVGSFTQNGQAISFIFLPQYKNVWEGVDLTVPFFVNYTLDGSFAYYNYSDKALWYSLGLEAVYLSSTTVGIVYSAYSGTNNMWQDRDNIAITAKYTF